MPWAVVALVLVAATACGTANRPAAATRWPAAAESTRTHWYRSLAQTGAVPVTQSKRDAKRALEQAAGAIGVRLVNTHYAHRAGGSAELIVQPEAPRSFADTAATRLTPLLAPLTHGDHAYLVTVVDDKQRPLLMLGWTPGVGGGAGEGIAWQAEGIRSSAIVGQPVTSPSTADGLMARLSRP
jgi:hypothetical protein